MDRKREASGGVFINIMEKLTMGAPMGNTEGAHDSALDGGIDGITLSAGLHTHSLRLIENHPRFRDVKIGIIVSSYRALKIFLRSASRLDRLPDYIVVEGPLAGGHLGFGDDWRSYRWRTSFDRCWINSGKPLSIFRLFRPVASSPEPMREPS